MKHDYVNMLFFRWAEMSKPRSKTSNKDSLNSSFDSDNSEKDISNQYNKERQSVPGKNNRGSNRNSSDVDSSIDISLDTEIKSIPNRNGNAENKVSRKDSLERKKDDETNRKKSMTAMSSSNSTGNQSFQPVSTLTEVDDTILPEASISPVNLEMNHRSSPMIAPSSSAVRGSLLLLKSKARQRRSVEESPRHSSDSSSLIGGVGINHAVVDNNNNSSSIAPTTNKSSKDINASGSSKDVQSARSSDVQNQYNSKQDSWSHKYQDMNYQASNSEYEENNEDDVNMLIQSDFEDHEEVYNNNDDEENFQEMNDSNINQEQCPHCSRWFNADPFVKHVKICEKVFQKKRKVFDSSKMRMQDNPELVKLSDRKKKESKRPGTTASNSSTTAGSSSTQTPSWKQQSEAFRASMRAAREYSRAEAEGRPLPAPVVSSVPDPSLIPCPHCQRRFNKTAAERHIPQCQNIKAKPTMLRRGSGLERGIKK